MMKRGRGGKRQPIAEWVRRRVQQGGERLWRVQDFGGVSFGAVAQALSRLVREDELRRFSKGVYYRPRLTAFGRSNPNPAAIRSLVENEENVFPAGIPAANLLGFSTQRPHEARSPPAS